METIKFDAQQQRFLDDVAKSGMVPSNTVVFVGGRGSGKTTVLIAAAVNYSVANGIVHVLVHWKNWRSAIKLVSARAAAVRADPKSVRIHGFESKKWHGCEPLFIDDAHLLGSGEWARVRATPHVFVTLGAGESNAGLQKPT
jgi:chromosomal replication initiation ATPase DnaA